MDLLKDANLIKADESQTKFEVAIEGKTFLCLYFSAHWCPPCRTFTPILKDFYDECSDDGLQIIFVSSDRSSADMLNYMKDSHGHWFALEHGSKVISSLKKKFEITGIPALVVIDLKSGKLITKDGRQDVQSKGPLTLQDWKYKL